MRVGKTPGRTTKLASCLLTASMILGFPGPASVQGATAAPNASTATGSLSVETDPVGATVMVDGESWGTTPVALRAIAPGDHRVRVVKQGYLDNSRVVSVQAGQAGRVQVKLTPHGQQDAVRAQVDTAPPPQKEGGSSKKKWVFIGLGAAAVGTAVYVVATKNGPPVAGTIGASPSATGMAGITTYTFTAQGASDPDNDPLTYSWNFGDSGSGSGSSTSHVYASAGTFSVTLTVSDGKHTVTAPSATVTVARSMAGAWTGGVEPGFNDPFTLNLTQSGTSLGGSEVFSGGTISGLTGTVSGTTYPATVNFAVTYSFTGTSISVTDRFTGTTDATGSTMTGTMTVTLTNATFTATGSSTATGPVTLRR
jgi:hypothetical protein